MNVPTGLLPLCLCRSMSPHSDLPRSPVIYQKINFEQISPHCPGDTIPAPQQALAAFRGLPPSVPWPPVLGARSALPRPRSPPRPRCSEPTKSYWNPGAGPSESGSPHPRPPPLPGRWSHWAQGPFRQERKPLPPQVDSGWVRRALAVSACITRRPVPVRIGTPGPLPRLLAPGVPVASWPSAPFPPGWSGEGGRRWGPAGRRCAGQALQSGKAGCGRVSGSLGGRTRVRVRTRALQGLAVQIGALPAAAAAGAAGWGASREPQAPELSGGWTAEGAAGTERSP